MGEALSILSVSKSYGDVPVITDLSLDIDAGEFIVFLGPSGCGKSTLLRMIAGLESLDSGAIHIGENRIDTLPPGDREVAMVFQHYALYPHMSVRDNMAFGLRNAGIDSTVIAERIAAAAVSLELDPLLDRKPGQLSGGQKQRVAIARAIVKHPKLFLLDEPLSNLDAALRTRTRLEIAQLHNRLGTTMVFVTHDQVEAMTLADRIVVLNKGTIEQIGTPMEVYRRPRTRFVAEFVGSPKINVLNGTVQSVDGHASFVLPCGARLATRVAVGGSSSAVLPNGAGELALRAENITVASADDATVKAMVVLVERLGDRTLVHARLSDGQSIVGEDRGDHAITVGDTIGLNLGGDAAMLVDADGNCHHGDRR